MRSVFLSLGILISACSGGGGLSGSADKSAAESGKSKSVVSSDKGASAGAGATTGATKGTSASGTIDADETITSAKPSANVAGAFLACAIDPSLAKELDVADAALGCGYVDATRSKRAEGAPAPTMVTLTWDDSEAAETPSLKEAAGGSRWQVYAVIRASRLRHLKSIAVEANGKSESVDYDVDADPVLKEQKSTRFVRKAYQAGTGGADCKMLGEGKFSLQADTRCFRQCQDIDGFKNGYAIGCEMQDADSMIQCACGDDADGSVAPTAKLPISAISQIAGLAPAELAMFCAESTLNDGGWGGYAFMRTYCAEKSECPDFGRPVECNQLAQQFTCACASGVRGRDHVYDKVKLATLSALGVDVPATCDAAVNGARASAAANEACAAHCKTKLTFGTGFLESCSGKNDNTATCLCHELTP